MYNGTRKDQWSLLLKQPTIVIVSCARLEQLQFPYVLNNLLQLINILIDYYQFKNNIIIIVIIIHHPRGIIDFRISRDRDLLSLY